MFAGVGPFAIMAAKHANPEKVIAIEKNPAAAEYLKQNIKLNKVENTVKGIQGDVKKVIPKLEHKFDRVIMPLPEKAENFLNLAKQSTVKEGIIHLYKFQGRAEDKFDIDDVQIKEKVRCGWKNPAVKRFRYDLEV